MTSSPRNFILSILIIFSTSCLQAAEDPIPRLKLLHPRPDMQFWVDQIEVAGDIPPGTEVRVAGEVVFPDDDGRFRHMLTLDRPTVLIPITETRGSRVFHDTTRVFHRAPDHMMADSIFINHNIPQELAINFVYPQSGNFRGSQISLRGRTHPEATLFMNNDTVKVYASGAYTIHVQIQPGENHFDFQATLDSTVVSERLTLTKPLPAPIALDLEPRTAQPASERWILAGEQLQVGIRGPYSKKVYYKIPGVTGWRILNESKPGHYQGSVQPGDIDKELNTRVLYRMGVLSKRIKSAPLRILTDALGGLTTHVDTRVYDTPSTDQLLFPMADSVSLQIIGLKDHMYHIQLGDYRTAYVRASRVVLNPESKLNSAHFLGSMQAENQEDWNLFRIYTGKQRLPFEIKEKAVPSRLELRVFGAKQGWEWTTYPEDDSAILFVERSQPEDLIWQMDFYPSQKFWGWFGRYEGDYLVIGIRKAPVISQDSLFANIRIEIDPGHGGWQRGALGLTGYAEADANLRYSLMLEKMLLEAGATVYLTRRDDRQLSLAQRAEIARNDSVHIFVMAHNNAPGSSRDILMAKGASTFYTWPSAKALSDKLYPHLSNMGIDTSGKVIRYYYYLTRQTEYLVYLIEGAFMTYPYEEMFLLSEEGLETLARAAYLGLEDFLLEQAGNPIIKNSKGQ
ncbi:MAG: N-acetylmuramoyl-L-alanine amidase [Candidatus Marinimicrobia bacterium]|nr:N-acetylmuramoyl-L-alanine amidase [Candidatus Neomarinimicrobiota bacterium]